MRMLATSTAMLASSIVVATTSMRAGDARVDWAGRTATTAEGGVAFDWLGVTARLQVQHATFVRATISSTAAVRGTRLKAYASDQGFMLYPQVEFWVDPLASVNNTLWLVTGKQL